MADIVCPKCKQSFDNNNPESFVTRAAAASAAAVAGFWLCGSIGILFGPGGGISGAVPGSIVGGVSGWLVVDQFRRCPGCKKIFKT
jgi:hypothetical protein